LEDRRDSGDTVASARPGMPHVEESHGVVVDAAGADAGNGREAAAGDEVNAADAEQVRDIGLE